MDAQNVVVLLVIVLVVAVVLFIKFRGSSGAKPPTAPAPRGEPKVADTPRATALDDRMEVEAPVEISEKMSLAEIKRAKAARITGKKGRRKTAMEATAEAQEEYDDEVEVSKDNGVAEPEVAEPEVAEPAAAEPDVSADDGWDLLVDDDDIDTAFAMPKHVPDPSEPKEVAEEPEPEPEPEAEAEPEAAPEPESEPESEPEDDEVEEPVGLDQMSESYGTPLAQGLERTRTGFIAKLGKLFRRNELDESLVEDLEEVLYSADIGSKAANAIIGAVEAQLSKDQKADPEAVWKFVRSYVEELLGRRESKIDMDAHKPYVILVIGVNGVGKTTTIGKMAAKFKRAGKKVLLVAGDTFRAAAVEQIEVWGQRTSIPVHTGDDNADPASVVFSGVERGKKEGFDVIICDTAGRLHTKAPLLDELEKISRVAQKVIDTAPHETILVLDANTGQNAIQQAKIFREAVPITGIVLTKLDGTAKGGVILGICDELDVPIRYIGIGESVADLRQFDAREFTEALFM